MSDSLRELIRRCVDELGERELERRLAKLLEDKSSESHILTIVSNAGVHKIPANYMRGDVYEASYGNWQVSSQEDLRKEFARILKGLADKLNEKRWNKIYLIPTGHPALSVNIKTFVYRVTRINTTDVCYLNGNYYEIDIDHRSVLLDSELFSEERSACRDASPQRARN